MKKFIFICFFCFLCSKIVFAQGYEKARYFDVDLDAPVPDLKLLKKEALEAIKSAKIANDNRIKEKN